MTKKEYVEYITNLVSPESDFSRRLDRVGAELGKLEDFLGRNYDQWRFYYLERLPWILRTLCNYDADLETAAALLVESYTMLSNLVKFSIRIDHSLLVPDSTIITTREKVRLRVERARMILAFVGRLEQPPAEGLIHPRVFRQVVKLLMPLSIEILRLVNMLPRESPIVL